MTEKKFNKINKMNKTVLDKITQSVGVGTISNRLRATSNVPLNKKLRNITK